MSLLGALLFGPDSATVAAARRDLVSVLSEGDTLRVTRLDGGEVRRDAATLHDALRARAFFPGRRVALLDGARDELAAAVAAGLEGLTIADAFLVIEAGALPAKSSLRKMFEGSRQLAACGLYADPPEAAELSGMLRAAGLTAGLTPDAEAALGAMSREMDRVQVTQLVETLALFGMARAEPLTEDEVIALSPAGSDLAVDRLVDAVASGRPTDVGPLLGRTMGSGSASTQTTILLGRHFRQLLALLVAADGPEAAINRMRPPLFGPRRNALLAQVRNWSQDRVESAIHLLQETERTLRSPGTRPNRAIVERCLLRIAMMGARR